ncbi:LacI family DNA-binding transcriptional regulator [Clostridium sp. E02]|uniref:LacI family DNA-binding transcriptional regulator n=1 Tax=Clostridium sp. E02 TaxID=2487134 RepID=UPI000F51E347|nr:LacI family DNA-binding transcriptional regulator [Clostridium sp. E02]
MVDIKFIAQKAGVSIATVSRVLNHSKPVSKKLEEKVLETVIKYNYYPKSSDRFIAAKRTFMISILIEDHINQFHSEFLPQITQHIAQAGYQALINIVGTSMKQKETSIHELTARRVEGIIALFHLDELSAKRLKSLSKVPFLYSEPLIKGVSYNQMNYNASYKVGEYLISLGHRKIGCVFFEGYGTNRYLDARYDGFIQALRDHDIRINENYFYKSDIKMQNGWNIGTIIDNTDDRPSALFCVSDELAIGMISALSQKGIPVPDEISIIGYDGIPLGQHMKPSLTSVYQPFEFWIKRIVDELIAEIEHKSLEPIREEVILENLPYIRICESCASPHQSV